MKAFLLSLALAFSFIGCKSKDDHFNESLQEYADAFGPAGYYVEIVKTETLRGGEWIVVKFGDGTYEAYQAIDISTWEKGDSIVAWAATASYQDVSPYGVDPVYNNVWVSA